MGGRKCDASEPSEGPPRLLHNHYAKIMQKLCKIYAKVMQSYAKLCKVMQSYAKLCKVMQSYAKQKYAKYKKLRMELPA